MGAYSPAPVLDAVLRTPGDGAHHPPHRRAMALPKARPIIGVLYAGLMLTSEGPKLIEYNARFGDPECQVLMMRLESDLAELLLACAEGKLAACTRSRFSPDTR
jgi:phosphoribosylamine--glycine ligase